MTKYPLIISSNGTLAELNTLIKEYDSVIYAYTDADTITIQAGGQFVSSDGTAMYTVASNTVVKLSTGLTNGQTESANTLYFVWGGVDSNGALKFYLSNSASSMPSELVKGRLLRGAVRNNNSSNLIDFRMTQRRFWYVANVDGGGSDVTEVLDATVSTTFVDVTCSGFLPPGQRGIIFTLYQPGGAQSCFWRDKDSSLPVGIRLRMSGDSGGNYLVNVNASGVFQFRNAASTSTRISLISYEL